MKVIVILIFVKVFISVSALTGPQQDYIDNLNDLRSNTNPSAANMRRIEWSDCLTKIVRDFAQLCNSPESRNPDRNTQAVAAGCVPEGTTVGGTRVSRVTETSSSFSVISAEKSNYNYAEHSCSGLCGNYLQAINAETDAVGCYRRDETDCGGTGYTIFCNYANEPVLSDRPYIEGVPCSQCPDDQSSCDDDGLCVRAETTQPTEPTKTVPTLPVTKPSPGGPKNHNHGHDHKDGHNHNHNHNHRPHGHKDKNNNPSIATQNSNKDGHNHGSHDHHNGHKKHDHNHGGPHDHAHGNGKNDDNGNNMMHRFSSQ